MAPPPFAPRPFFLSFGAALVCGLAVFMLPRAIFNSIAPAVAQTAAQRDSAHLTPPPAPPAQAPAVATTPADTTHARAAMPVSMGMRLTGLIGIVMILLVGWLLSRERKAVDWRVIFTGLLLQFVFAIFVLRVPFGQALFRKLGAFVTAVLGFSYAGSSFVFGKIGAPLGGDSNLGVIFAFQILP